MDAHGGQIGDYELEELLGRGGMGEVWRATDTRRGRTIAVKLLAADLTDRDDFRERFRREARLTASLSSPHVIPIHDWGEVEDRLFLDMRLVEGGSLADVVARQPGGVSPAWALTVLAQVAEALDSAHDRGMLHRDVKPANVLVAGRSSAPFCYLTDFGIAKIVDETSAARLTESGQLLGTVAYMAPELFTDGVATAAVDVYALGCLFYEMLTGRRAFPSTSAASAMNEHVFGTPPRPGDHRADLACFDAVLAVALAKGPTDRPTSCGALAAAAQEAWSGATGATSHGSSDLGAKGPGSASDDPTRIVTGHDARPHVEEGRSRIGRWGWRPALVLTALVLVAAVVGAVALSRTTESRNGVAAPTPTATTAPTTSSPFTGPATATARVLPVTVENANSALAAPDGSTAFITDADSENVRRVDLDTGAVTATYRVPDGVGPGRMQLSPDRRILAVQLNGYTSDNTSTGLALIDLASGTSSVIPLPTVPGDIVFSADGASVFVSLQGPSTAVGNSVAVVDVATRRLSRTVPVTADPGGLALSADGSTLAVACYGPPEDSGGAVDLVPVAGGPVVSVPSTRPPLYVAPLPDGRFAISVVYARDGAVDVVDPRTRTISTRYDPTITAPARVVPTPDGRRLLTAQSDTSRTPPVGEVALLDVATGRNLLRVSAPQLQIAVPTPDGRRAVIVTTTSVSVVDLPP